MGKSACGVLIYFWLSAAVAQGVPSGEGFSAGHTGLPPSEEEAWSATVHINHLERNCDSNQPFSMTNMTHKWGTGVVVHYDPSTRMAIVATNSHVLNKCTSGMVTTEIGFTKSPDSAPDETTSKFDVILNRPEVDLALLRVQVPKKANIAAVKLGVPRSGEEVFAIGYPDTSLRKDWNVDQPKKGSVLKRYSRGLVRSIAPHYPLGTGKSGGKPTIQYAPVILHSADLLPGNSGGPLLSKSGELIGLNSRMNRSISPKEKERQGKDNYFYCANRPVGETDCQNLAISAELISKEVDKLIH